MHGFSWVDRRGQDGIGYVRALCSLLTAHLPQIPPDMRGIIEREISKSYDSKFKTINCVKHFPAFEEMKRAVVKANGLAFFGRDLVSNQEFMDAALNNIEHVIWASEWIRAMPKFLSPYTGKFLCSCTKTQKTCRLKDGKQSKGHPNDCIQCVMDNSPKDNPWDAGRIVHEMMAPWFGSVHGLSITTTYALFDLCRHPEYVEPLWKELEDPNITDSTEPGRRGNLIKWASAIEDLVANELGMENIELSSAIEKWSHMISNPSDPSRWPPPHLKASHVPSIGEKREEEKR
ncbi:hypothetical protein GJ744_004545 [Endocarpon pusillum]|uniref:Cytochrome P450 n=1 Tax=Endocarpon pusillum TaxID=364733 RepID=A0A8H7AZZ0_9EURO|nr:hypothetical protein GJ744_004545 [Endocarpon pusillum]